MPLALIGISLFTWDFAVACDHAQGLTSVSASVGSPLGWRILLDLGLLSGCGGFYSVPLYTMIQQEADPAWRARMVAASNVVNAAFMVGGSVVTAALAAIGVSPTGILIAIALVNMTAVVWRLTLPTNPGPILVTAGLCPAVPSDHRRWLAALSATR